MRAGPYRRPPGRYRLAVLTEDGLLLDEDGCLCHPDELPEDCRAFGQWDVVRRLLRAGIGEALCWKNEEVKWRRTPDPEATEWRDDRRDVGIHRVPLHPRQGVRAFLRDLIAWRDYLEQVGASVGAPGHGGRTVGSASWGLLRASLSDEINFGRAARVESAGPNPNRPPIFWTRGGRIQDGPAGPGCYRGQLVQLDLPSAYSSLLGGLRYGGWWRQVPVAGRHFDRWLTERPEPMFVRAQVQVPELPTGPLLRWSRHRTNWITLHDLALKGPSDPAFPSGCFLAGTWTRAELLEAMRAGCAVEPLQAWVHHSSRQPFARWWELVGEGRELLRGGPGETLVKMTGNALVGNFSREDGRRTLWRGGRRMRPCSASGFVPYAAHDLGEFVTGTTRARLYELIRWAGERLLTAHTDGAWIVDDGSPWPEGWRVKRTAHQLDLLGPSCYRYWRGRWATVLMAGAPPSEAEEAFSEKWAAWLDREAAA